MKKKVVQEPVCAAWIEMKKKVIQERVDVAWIKVV